MVGRQKEKSVHIEGGREYGGKCRKFCHKVFVFTAAWQRSWLYVLLVTAIVGVWHGLTGLVLDKLMGNFKLVVSPVLS